MMQEVDEVNQVIGVVKCIVLLVLASLLLCCVCLLIAVETRSIVISVLLLIHTHVS